MRSNRWNDETGLRRLGLEPRAAMALGVVALGLFLMISLAKYGATGLAAAAEVPWHVAFAGWFVQVFGAGAWLLVVLPTIWGVIVYFRESTPNLVLRAAGVVVLACATAMITGLLQEVPGPWAGSVGAFSAWLAKSLGGLLGAPVAQALVWCGSIVLFVTSLIWATDWMFHSVRRGDGSPLLGLRQVALEQLDVELRDTNRVADEDERELIPASAPPHAVAEAVRAAGDLPEEREDETGLPRSLTAESSVPDVTDFVDVDMGQEFDLPGERPLPDGFSVTETEGRVVVQGPTGYRGVEFLPPSEELAVPEVPEEATFDVLSFAAGDVLDDRLEGTEIRYEAAADADEVAAPEHENVVVEADAEVVATAPMPARELEVAGDDAAVVSDSVLDGEPLAPAGHVAPAYAEPEPEPEPETVEPKVARVAIAELPEPAVAEAPMVAGDPLPSTIELIDDELVSLVPPTTAYVAPAAPEPVAPAPETADDGSAVEAERRSGIGLPASSPFVDEFFPADASFDHSGVLAGDGASSHQEVASTYGGTPPFSSSLPETVTSAELLLPAETAVTPPAPRRDRPVPAPGAAKLDRLHAMELDPLFASAVDAVIDGGRGSPMVLQRRLGIGHGRGLRILNQMAQAGLVGPEDPTGARSLQVSRTEWETFVGSQQL